MSQSRRFLAAKKFSILFVAVISMLAMASSAQASVNFVTNLNDSGAGSLREAVALANVNGLMVEMMGLSGEINLTSGQIEVTGNFTIRGDGADVLAINAGSYSRVFLVHSGSDLYLEGVTLRNGLARGDDGLDGEPADGGNPGLGGAIWVTGDGSKVYASDCSFESNLAQGGHGGNSTGNTGAGGGGLGGGGAVFVDDAGFFQADRCLFKGNQAIGGEGGAFMFAGGAGAGIGGAVLNYDGTANLYDSTFAGNVATGGAGINNIGGSGGAGLSMGAGGTFGQGGQGYQDGGSGGWGAGGGACSDGLSQNAGSGGFGGGGGNAAGQGSPAGSMGFGGDATAGDGSGGGAGLGGAVFTNGVGGATTNVRNCTITGNWTELGLNAAGGTNEAAGTGHGGGLFEWGGSTTNIKNTIVSGNNSFSSGPDCWGDMTSAGYNHVGDTAASNGWAITDTSGFDPQLEDLGYWGSSKTMCRPPKMGSAMIDAGENTGVSAMDQRGAARIINAGTLNVDKGAYEYDPPPSLTIQMPTAAPSYYTVNTYIPDISGIASPGAAQMTLSQIDYEYSDATVLTGTANGTTNWEITGGYNFNEGHTTIAMTAYQIKGTYSTTVNLELYVDTTPPNVTISPDSGTYGQAQIPFTFVWDDTMSNFSQEDIQVNNGAKSNFNTSDNITYTVDITPGGEGNVEVWVPGGVCDNMTGFANNASLTSTVLYRKVSPGTHFVDSSAATYGDGSSPASPWPTISDALAEVANGNAGDYTLVLAAGTYSEATGEHWNGIWINTNNLILQGAGPLATIIEGPGGMDWDSGIKVNANNVTIKDLAVRDFNYGSGYGGIHLQSGSGHILNNVHCYDNSMGAYIDMAVSNCQVMGDSKFYHNKQYGLLIGGDYNLIYDNDSSFADNGENGTPGTGIYLQGGADYNEIYNNNIYSTMDPSYPQQWGIVEFGCLGNQIYKNQIHGHQGTNYIGYSSEESETDFYQNELFDNFDGIYLSTNTMAGTYTIVNNLVYDTNTPGSYVVNHGIKGSTTGGGSPLNILAWHNTINGGNEDGIFVNDLDGGVLDAMGNMVTNFMGFGMFLGVPGTFTVDYNNSWNNGAGAYGGELVGQDGVNGNINVDPGYADAVNGLFSPSAPQVIDVIDSASDPVDKDFYNKSRPQGTDNDMGAVEVVNQDPVLAWDAVNVTFDGNGYVIGTFTVSDPETDNVVWYESYCSFTSAASGYATFTPLIPYFDEADADFTAFTPMTTSAGGTLYTIVVDASTWPDDDYALRLKVSDTSGNHSNYPLSNTFTIDNTPPSDTTVSSAAPLTNTVTALSTVTLTWNTGTDPSGMGGFSWVVDQNPGTDPDQLIDDFDPPDQINIGPANGDWWLHLASVDIFGNWTPTLHVGPWTYDDGPPNQPLVWGPGFAKNNMPTWQWASSGGGDYTVYVGGTFTNPSNRVVGYSTQTQTWFNLGTGADATVRNLAVDQDGNLYAAGDFSSVDSTPANGISKWDPVGQTWSTLGGDLNAAAQGFALAIDGQGAVFVGGLFNTADGSGVSNLAMWDPVGTNWYTLAGGVNNRVDALGVDYLGRIVAAGQFTMADGMAASRLASYDLMSNTWSELGGGLNGGANALAMGPGTVYVGGSFSTAGGVPADAIAAYDFLTESWLTFGSGMDAAVTALAVDYAGDLYAGGAFNTAGGSAIGKIARWDGVSWNAMGGGVNNSVYALQPVGSDVFAGGAFTDLDEYIAVWDTAMGPAWYTIASNLDSDVNAIAVAGRYRVKIDDSDLSTGATYVANTIWAADTPLSDGVHTLYVEEGDASGNWSSAGSFAVQVDTIPPNDPILDWATPAPGDFTNLTEVNFSWTNATDPGGSGVFGYSWVWDSNPATVPDQISDGGVLPLTGTLAAPGEWWFHVSTVDNAGNWTGTLHVGPWYLDTDAPNQPMVYASGSTNNSRPTWQWASGGGGSYTVYVGGLFTDKGSRVAKWNSDLQTWSSMGAGVDGDVYALAVNPGGDVYVGGSFLNAGGAAASRIALWDEAGDFWSALSDGVDNSVKALVVDGQGNVYAGGDFNNSGATPMAYFGMWDANGTFWSQPGSGMVGGVSALELGMNGDIYLGGGFNDAGGVSVNQLAGYSPLDAAYYDISNGVDAQVQALAMGQDGKLYVGGPFSNVGGVLAASSIAYFDIPTQTWSAMDDGLNGVVYGLDIDGQGGVYAAGGFNFTGAMPLNYAARWNSGGPWWEQLDLDMDAGTFAVARAGEDVYYGGLFTAPGSKVAYWSTAGAPGFYTMADGVNNTVRALAVSAIYRCKVDDPDLTIGATYTAIPVFAPDTPLSDGMHTLYVEEGDAAGNWSSAGSFAIQVDTTPPTVNSITLADPNPTSLTCVVFDVSFDSFVQNVKVSDFSISGTITGGTVDLVSGNDDFYTVTVCGYSSGSSLRLDLIDDDSITDDAGNPLGGPGAGNGDYIMDPGSGYVVDLDAPSAVITPDGITVGQDMVQFLFQWDEAVMNFEIADINVINGTGSNFFQDSATAWSLDVTPTAPGNVTVEIPAGVCVDMAGNPNAGPLSATILYRVLTPGDWYVDATASVEGNGTDVDPWKTLSFAMAEINAGTAASAGERYTLHVAPGDYSIPANNEWDDLHALTQNQTTILGADRSTTFINGISATIWGAGLLIEASDCRVENLSVHNFSGLDGPGILINSGTNNVVFGCDAYDNEFGVLVSPGSSNSEITGDTNLFHNDSVGALLDNTDGNEVFGNLGSIYDNGTAVLAGVGVFVYGGNNNLVHGNSIYWSGNTSFIQGVGVHVDSQTAGNEVYRNLIYGHAYDAQSRGVLLQNTSADVYQNEIRDNYVGLQLWAEQVGYISTPLVENNLIHDTMEVMGTGVMLLANGSGDMNPAVVHNTIVGGMLDGVEYNSIYNTTTGTIENNIITGFGNSCVNVSDQVPLSWVFRGNDVYCPGSVDYLGISDQTGFNDNINEDPLFVGGTDYQLMAASPCVDADATSSATDDYDEVSRPQRSAYDMGAFEHVNEPPVIGWDWAAPRLDGSHKVDLAFTGADPESDTANWVAAQCQYSVGPTYDVWNDVAVDFDTGDGKFTANLPKTFLASGSQYTVVVNTTSWSDGDYKVRLQVEDPWSGVSNNPESAPFMVDNTPPNDPTNETADPVVGLTNDNTVALTWTENGDMGGGVIAGYSWLVDDQAFTLPNHTVNGVLPPEEITLTEGTNYLHLSTVDSYGNWTSTVHLGSWDLDTAPPSVPGLDPVQSPTNQASQFIEGSKDMNSSVWLDGNEIVAIDSSMFWSYDLALNPGNNAFGLTSKDSLGNESAVTSGFIYYDNVEPSQPTLDTVTPASGGFTNLTQVVLTWTSAGSDPGGSGVNGYSWLVDQISDSDPDGVTNGVNPPTNLEIGPTEGDWYFHIRTRDNAGNLSATLHYGAWQLDSTPPMDPTVSGSIPVINVPTNATTVTLDWNPGSDISGMADYSWHTDQLAASLPDTIPDGVTPPGSVSIGPAQGDWYLHLRSRDGAGNWSSTIHYGPWNLDTTAPDPPTLNAVTTPTNQTSQILSGGKQSDTSVWLNGAELVVRDPNTSWSQPMPLVQGNNAISLTAKDEAGNESSATVSNIFMDDQNPADPTLFSTLPAQSTSTAFTEVSLVWVEHADPGGSGVNGYAWTIDQTAVATPAQVTMGASPPTDIEIGPADGDWYAHLATRDNAGNWTTTVNAGPWTLDRTAPSVPVITTNGGADFTTSAAAVTLTGTCAADSQVILVNGAVDGVTYTAGNTFWSVDRNLAPGANLFEVTATDALGNESAPASISVDFVLEPGTYYTDMGSGADELDHGTAPGTGAFRTLHYTLDLVNAGNPGVYTVYVANGSYTVGNGEEDEGLFLAQNFTRLIGTGPAPPSLDGTGNTFWGTGLVIAAQNCRVSRFDITGFVDQAVSVTTGSGHVLDSVNLSQNPGQGVANNAELTIVDSTLSENGSGGVGLGGGISNGSAGILSLERSTLWGNEASNNGGGIYIWPGGIVSVQNSTFSANQAPGGCGGAINVPASATLNLSASTIAGNTAGCGDGIYVGLGGSANIKGSVFSNNGAEDCQGTVNSLGYNVVSNDASSAGFNQVSDQVNVAAMLGPLADNGGPTLTHALLPTSPALGNGSCTDVWGGAIETDQREFPRPGADCDAGAYEDQNSVPALGLLSLVQRTDGSSRVEIVFSVSDPEDDDVNWTGYTEYAPGPSFVTFSDLVNQFDTGDPKHTAPAFDIPAPAGGAVYTAVVNASGWATNDYLFRLQVFDGVQDSDLVNSAPYLVDNSMPIDPAASNENPAVGLPTSQTEVTMDWTPGTDPGGSGVAGYSWLVTQNFEDVPPQTLMGVDPPGSATIGPAEGDWYLRVSTVDNRGNWTGTATVGPWQLDTTEPGAPTVETDTPTRFTPQNVTGTKDVGTSVWLEGQEIYPPDSGTSWNYDLDLVQGNNDFSFTSKDEAGNQSAPTDVSIFLDQTLPNDPSVQTAHPAANESTSSSTVTLAWNPGTDPGGSGVAGYSWVLDQQSETVPSQIVDGENPPETVLIGPAQGDWWLHISTVDHAGNWTSTYHYGPWDYDTSLPAAPFINPVATPTNQASQTIGGTKEPFTSVWLNGVEIWPLDSGAAWSHTMNLAAGNNHISVVAKDAAENASSPCTADIWFDNQSPADPTLDAATPEPGVTKARVIGLAWTENVDPGGSGVNGYAWLVDQMAGSVPSQVTMGVNPPTEAPIGPAQGDWWFHLSTRDNAGNWTSTVHVGPWTYDTVAPAAPGLDSVVSPTNLTPQTIGGSKDAGASVWLNGVQVVAVGDVLTTWSHSMDLAAGANAISLTSGDAAGNESAATLGSIYYDNQNPADPTLNSADPIQGATTNQSAVALDWTENPDPGGSGVNGYAWLVDQVAGSVPAQVTMGVSPPTETVIGPAQGEWWFHLSTRDNAGNWTSTVHVGPWTYDTVAPAAPGLDSVVSPTNLTPQTIGGSKDAGASVWLNGVQVVAVGDVLTTWSYSLDLVAGANAISLTSGDAAGNESAATLGSIYYDNQNPADPTLNSADPIQGATTNQSAVSLDWTENPDPGGSGVNGYAWLVDQVAGSVPAQVTMGVNPPAEAAIGPAQGDWWLHLSTRDNAGNWTGTVHAGPWTYDTIGPAAPGLDPVDTPTNVTPQVIGGSKDADADVWLNGVQIVGFTPDATWSYSLDLVAGANAISLTSGDAAGNESGATVSSIVYDTQAPAAPGLNPVVSPTNVTPQVIGGSKDADASVWLNGVQVAGFTPDTTWSHSLDLVAGANAISLTSGDAAGNESGATAGSIYFDNENPADPTLVTADPEPGSTMEQTTVTLAWTENPDPGGSGVNGYAWVVNQLALSQPPQVTQAALPPDTIEVGPADGDWYLHLSTRDNAGNWTTTVHAGPWTYESPAPPAPVIVTNGGVDFTATSAALTLTGTCSDETHSITVNGSTDGVVYTAGDTGWLFVSLLDFGGNAYAVQALNESGTPSEADSITVTYRLASGTYWVNNADGTDDSDHGSGPGLEAFATIHYAVDQVNAGEPGAYTILVEPGAGTYQTLGITNPEPDQPLILTQNNTKLMGTAPGVVLVSAGNAGWMTAVTCDADNLAIQGMTMTDFDAAVFARSGRAGIMVRENIINAGEGFGVVFEQADGAVINNQMIGAFGEDKAGVAITGASPDVQGNLIYWFVVGIHGTNSSSWVQNNTLLENDIGVYDFSGNSMTVLYNVITHSGTGVDAPASATVGFNCLWENTVNISGGVIMEASNILADPMYADYTGFDFRLLPGSPGLNASLRVDPGVDLDGVSRPQYRTWDLGAYELSGLDSDEDGLPDYAETNTGVYVNKNNTGSDPNNPDSDEDGLGDGAEVITYATNPNNGDTDGDTQGDGKEVNTDETDPLDKYSFKLPAGAPPRFQVPPPSEAQSQAMLDRPIYKWSTLAQRGGNNYDNLTYGLDVPVAGAQVVTWTDGLGRDIGTLEFEPAGVGTFTFQFTVRDDLSGLTALSEAFTVTVTDALDITPDGYTIIRPTGGNVVEPFVLSGGTPFTGSQYYKLEVRQDGASSDPIDVFVEEGIASFDFDTANRVDGEYFLYVWDKWTFDPNSTGQDNTTRAKTVRVTLKTIQMTQLAAENIPAGGGSVDVTGTGSDFDGSSITVPAGSVPAGTDVSFSRVDSGAPFVDGEEIRGTVIDMAATDEGGNPVSLTGPVTVTIPYAGLLAEGEDAHDLVIIHFNQETGRWEKVPGLQVDVPEVGFITFTTDHFSLYCPVIPTAFDYAITGGEAVQDYVMMHFPGVALNGVLDTFTPFMGAPDDRIWRMFAFDTAKSEYVELTPANGDRFTDEFASKPGQGYFLISRYDQTVVEEGLAWDNTADGAFYTVWYPGWNLFSHPWKCGVSLATHTIEVSEDGETWVSIESGANSLTEDRFWGFKGATGAAGAWYDAYQFATDTLAAKTAYWTATEIDRPVFVRMAPIGEQALCKRVPDKVRMLAGKWLDKGLGVTAGSAIAAAGDDVAPPDPPGVSHVASSAGAIGTQPDLGVASGGGSCFVETVTAGASTTGLLLILGFFALAASARRLVRARVRDRQR